MSGRSYTDEALTRGEGIMSTKWAVIKINHSITEGLQDESLSLVQLHGKMGGEEDKKKKKWNTHQEINLTCNTHWMFYFLLQILLNYLIKILLEKLREKSITRITLLLKK